MNNKFPKKKYQKISDYADEYFSTLTDTLKKINVKQLNAFANILHKTIKLKGTLFVCGNGGSAAIANHFLCDYMKYVATGTNLNPKIISLSSNVEVITAIANDFGYEKIFSYQLEKLSTKKDVLLTISSSGNSPNIIKAIELAKTKKLKTISFSGFSGGKANKLSDIKINFNIANYGLSEDTHHIMMHVICQYLKQNAMKSKDIKNFKF